MLLKVRHWNRHILMNDLKYVKVRCSSTKHITISYSSNIDNPMVFGLVKSQIIVLPTVVVETMNDKEIEYIILHELSHVKSHDLIFNQLYVVLK